MRLIHILLCLLFVSTLSYSQVSISEPGSVGRGHAATTFATDYRAIGVNAANLGMPMEYETKKITFGLMEFNGSIQTNGFTKKDFFQSLSPSGGLSRQDQQDVSGSFSGADFGFNMDINPVNFAIQLPGIGGFAFGVHWKSQFYSRLGPGASDILSLGKTANYWDNLILNNGDTVAYNEQAIDTLDIDRGIRLLNPLSLSDLLDGSRVSGATYLEWNVSYGREILNSDFLNLYAGVGVKLIQGMAMSDIEVDKANNINRAFISVSPIFDEMANNWGDPNPIFDVKNFSLGFGFDFGVSAVYKEKFKFGAAINNIGSVNWDGIVWELKDSLITETATDGIGDGGFMGYWNSILNSADLGITEQRESRKTQLPTTLRIGLGQMLVDNKAQIGIDVILPLNDAAGNIERPIVALGGDFRIAKFFKISTGVNFGSNGDRMNIPLGVTFVIGEFGTYEIGLASRDIVTYVVPDVSPTISVAFAFLRFRI